MGFWAADEVQSSPAKLLLLRFFPEELPHAWRSIGCAVREHMGIKNQPASSGDFFLAPRPQVESNRRMLKPEFLAQLMD